MSLDFLHQIVEVDLNREYWFVRTDGGENFEAFYKHSFIAIGWNHITIDDLVNRGAEEVKEKISRELLRQPVEDGDTPFDPESQGGKSKVTGIYNKLNNFRNLGKGDVVIVPSAGSEELAFGVIEDVGVYISPSGSNDCDHVKRRHINWVALRSMNNDLDPKFHFIKSNRHAISSVKTYAEYIDKVVQSVYFKGEYGHVVLDLAIQDDMNAKTLITFIDNFLKLSRHLAAACDLVDNVDETSVRLNLQSPGFVEIMNKGQLTVLASLIVLTAACGTEDNLTGDQRAIYQEVKKAQPKLIKSFEGSGDSMKLKIDRYRALNQ